MSHIPYPLLPLEPGTKTEGYMKVPGIKLALPYTYIAGIAPGKSLLITAGVHGSEYPAIQTARRLSQELDPMKIRGNVLIIPVVNQSAFCGQLKAVMAEDGENLNRMFPGDPQGSVSQRLAHFLLQELMIPSDFYIDMHGGDLGEDLTPLVFHPTVADPGVAEKARQAAVASGFPYLIASRSTTGAYNSAASHGTPSLLTELGRYGLWDESEVERYTASILRIMAHLSMVSLPLRPTLPKPVFCSAVYEVEAEHDGFWQPVCKIGNAVEKGDKLGAICDVFGATLSEYFAPVTGVLLYQTISLSVNKGGFLAAAAEVLDGGGTGCSESGDII